VAAVRENGEWKLRVWKDRPVLCTPLGRRGGGSLMVWWRVVFRCQKHIACADYDLGIVRSRRSRAALTVSWQRSWERRWVKSVHRNCGVLNFGPHYGIGRLAGSFRPALPRRNTEPKAYRFGALRWLSCCGAANRAPAWQIAFIGSESPIELLFLALS